LNEEKSGIENGLNNGILQGDELVAAAKRLNDINEILDEKEFRWLELSEYL
jgi:ATP-binding cassette subfamily F protein uup